MKDAKRSRTYVPPSFAGKFFAILGKMFLLILPVALISYAVGRYGSVEHRLEYREPQTMGHKVPDSLAASLTCRPSIYVPAFSHIYVENGQGTLLTITLSVRNMSSSNELVLEAVEYFDTAGELVKGFFSEPLLIGPLQTAEFLVGESETEGGSGANFLIRWHSLPGVAPPMTEAVMVGKTGAGIISFSSRGELVQEPVNCE